MFWKDPAQGGADPNCDSGAPCICRLPSVQAGQTTPVRSTWIDALNTGYDESSHAKCANLMSKTFLGTDKYYLDSVNRIDNRDTLSNDYCNGEGDESHCVVNGVRLDPRGSAVYREYFDPTSSSRRRVVFAPCARPPRSPSTCLTRRPAPSPPPSRFRLF